ncbi:sugar kinase [Streptomyces sp. NPDC002643]
MTAEGLRRPEDAPDPAVVDVVDVVTLGESMVTFLPSRPGRLADVPSFDRAIGGAESNVACALAAAGHTARWVSRVGADGFGDHLIETIGAHGVDVSSVRRDPDRPTGVYFRTANDRSTTDYEVAYYRAGSAASAMSIHNTDLTALRAARVLHLSGITAALSDDCLHLLRTLTAPQSPSTRPLISFDVNHRAGLWRDSDDGPQTLLDLARNADIVFVGEDEAEEAWGIKGGPNAIRAFLPHPRTLVVKQGARGATLFERTPPPTTDQPPTDGRGRAGVSYVRRVERLREVHAPEPPGRTSARDGLTHRPGPGPHSTEGAPETALTPTGPGPHSTEGAPETALTPTGPDPHPTKRAAAHPAEGAAAHATEDATAHPAEGGATHSTERATAHPTEATPETTLTVPAPHVHVIAAVGAGDAFAAGFLSATLRGLPPAARLRHGHLMAAAALTTPGDLAEPPPTRAHADRLAALDDTAWETLRLGPGWTRNTDRDTDRDRDGAEEEVRTP